MQFFFVSLQTDCSTLNTTQFLLTVMELMTQFSWEELGLMRSLRQHVKLRGNQQGPSAPLIEPILETVENTGVRLMEEREATVSTSLWLVQYVYCVSKTTLYPFYLSICVWCIQYTFFYCVLSESEMYWVQWRALVFSQQRI